MKVRLSTLGEMCRKLIDYDPNIVEVVQFGSSVYMLDYANDLDLLIFTRGGKDYDGYYDCLMGLPFDVDILVKEVGVKLVDDLAIQVRGAYKVLYGDGRYLHEATDGALNRLVERLRANPTFEEARSCIRRSKRNMRLAFQVKNAVDRDGHIRDAFNQLAHACRIASLTYLSIEGLGWRGITRRLPSPLKKRFRAVFSKLHVEYFYDGSYPKERAREEFDKWLKKVDEYVKELEGRALAIAQSSKPCLTNA